MEYTIHELSIILFRCRTYEEFEKAIKVINLLVTGGFLQKSVELRRLTLSHFKRFVR